MEEEGSGGGCTRTKDETKNIKRQRDTQETERRLQAEVPTKNGGTDLFNDRRPSEQNSSERKKEGDGERGRGRQGERRRIRKSEGVRETDVALASPGRLIASGPLPCQALTPPSSAVIYRLRFARFKHHSVVIMAGEGRMTFLGWEAELDPRSSRPPRGVKQASVSHIRLISDNMLMGRALA